MYKVGDVLVMKRNTMFCNMVYKGAKFIITKKWNYKESYNLVSIDGNKRYILNGDEMNDYLYTIGEYRKKVIQDIDVQ